MMKTIAFLTLGCKVNQYDTEAMREVLLKSGYTEVPFDEKADVYLINTCTVTATGEQKSRQMLHRAHEKNPDALIVAAGCFAQRAPELAAKIPGVGLVIGVQDRSEIALLIGEALAKKEPKVAVAPLVTPMRYEEMKISRSVEHVRANLKIQEGCRQFCAYCIIPFVRGPLRSRSIADTVDQAKLLCLAGHSEIVLTGIHLTSYGTDWGQDTAFPGQELAALLKELDGIEGLARIRLGSVEPQLLNEGFLSRAANVKKLCPHFHVSLQSGSAGVLKRMNRTYTPEEYEKGIALLRSFFPDCAVTTDVMCGFPGETEQEHAESLAFVERIAFSSIHVFPYSVREGTAAARMGGQLSKAEKKRRAGEMLLLGEKLVRRHLARQVGRTVSVLFERKVDHGLYEGHTPQYLRVLASEGKPGAIAPVTILRAEGDALYGETLENGKEN